MDDVTRPLAKPGTDFAPRYQRPASSQSLRLLAQLPDESMRCPTPSGVLTRRQCGHRWVTFNATIGKGAGRTGSSCTGCPIGADHARGVVSSLVATVAKPVRR